MSDTHSTPTSKVCKSCGIDKPLDNFHKSPTCKYGRRTVCKECRKPSIAAYTASHREEEKKRSRDYYHANKERCLQYSLDWQRRNKEVCNERKKKWRNSEKGKLYMQDYAANYDTNKRRETCEKWYQNNKDKALHSGRLWRKENRQKVASYRRNRRAMVAAAEGSHTVDDIKRLLFLQQCKCANCKISIKKFYHVDHIIPISKGGTNDYRNLQLLCKTCNLKKSNLMPEEFAWRQGRLL